MCTTPSKSAYLFMVLSGGIIDTYPGGGKLCIVTQLHCF